MHFQGDDRRDDVLCLIGLIAPLFREKLNTQFMLDTQPVLPQYPAYTYLS